MLLHEVTGRQLRDARQALGFSLSRLAVRAGINRVCIRIYESHGDDVPNAHTHALGRLTRALQDEGVEFLPDGGVHLDERTALRSGLTAHNAVTAP